MKFSQHLIQRLRQRGINEKDIALAVKHGVKEPDLMTPGRFRYTRKGLVVIVKNNTVITALRPVGGMDFEKFNEIMDRPIDDMKEQIK